MRLTAEAVTAARVAVTNKLIELRGTLYISDLGLLANNVFYPVEVLSAVQNKAEPLNQLRALIADAGVQIRDIAVVVVEHLEVVTRRLCEQYPAAAPEHLNVLFVVQREARDYYVAAAFLATFPAHKAVYVITPFGVACNDRLAD